MNHINFNEKAGFNFKIKKPELNYLWVLVCVLGLIAACFTFSYIQHRRIKAAEILAANESVEVEALKAKKAASDIKATSASAGNADQLNNPIQWSDLLDDLSIVLPPSIQIISIQGTLTQNRVLTILASSDDLSLISDVKNQFADFKWCERVDLISLSRSDEAKDNEQFSFQLDCLLK
jgi:Tfp pilus assembly protein PilN